MRNLNSSYNNWQNYGFRLTYPCIFVSCERKLNGQCVFFTSAYQWALKQIATLAVYNYCLCRIFISSGFPFSFFWPFFHLRRMRTLHYNDLHLHLHVEALYNQKNMMDKITFALLIKSDNTHNDAFLLLFYWMMKGSKGCHFFPHWSCSHLRKHSVWAQCHCKISGDRLLFSAAFRTFILQFWIADMFIHIPR